MANIDKNVDDNNNAIEYEHGKTLGVRRVHLGIIYSQHTQERCIYCPATRAGGNLTRTLLDAKRVELTVG